ALHLVAEPRTGAREERRLGHRLPGRERRPRRPGARRHHIQGEALLGSRPARHGLRALSAPTLSATRAGGEPRLREVLASPKMLAILFLGAASGFPNQITESALQAWLKDAGVSLTTIGVMSYVALPYLLKFLWAPLIDRYPLPRVGRGAAQGAIGHAERRDADRGGAALQDRRRVRQQAVHTLHDGRGLLEDRDRAHREGPLHGELARGLGARRRPHGEAGAAALDARLRGAAGREQPALLRARGRGPELSDHGRRRSDRARGRRDGRHCARRPHHGAV